MNKSIVLWAFALITLSLSSCTKDSLSTDPTEYANESIQELETRTRTGRGGCFELVFPLSVVMPDSTVLEATSYASLKEAIKNWRKDNPDFDRKVRPNFVYPINVITKEGETISIDNEKELKELYKDCRKNLGNYGKPCFTLNYPISISFPNGTTTAFDSGKAMAEALRRWKKANPNATTRPVMVYPISVTLEDGSSVTVNSKEELRRLKEDCK
jgi:hypothetical protein